MTAEEFLAALAQAEKQWEQMPEWKRQWIEWDLTHHDGKCPPRPIVISRPYDDY